MVKHLLIIPLLAVAMVAAQETPLSDQDVTKGILEMEVLNEKPILSNNTSKTQIGSIILKDLAQMLMALAKDVNNNKEIDWLPGFHILFLKANFLLPNENSPLSSHVKKTMTKEQIQAIVCKKVSAVEIIGVIDGNKMYAVAAFLVENEFMSLLFGIDENLELSVKALFLTCKVILTQEVLLRNSESPYALGVSYVPIQSSCSYNITDAMIKWIKLRQRNMDAFNNLLKAPIVLPIQEGWPTVQVPTGMIKYNSFSFGFMQKGKVYYLVIFFDTGTYGYKIKNYWDTSIAGGASDSTDSVVTTNPEKMQSPSSNAMLHKALSEPSLQVGLATSDVNASPSINPKSTTGPNGDTESSLANGKINQAEPQQSTLNSASKQNLQPLSPSQVRIPANDKPSTAAQPQGTSATATTSRVRRWASENNLSSSKANKSHWTNEVELKDAILAAINFSKGKEDGVVRVVDEGKANVAANIALLKSDARSTNVIPIPYDDTNYLVKSIRIEKFQITKGGTVLGAVKDALKLMKSNKSAGYQNFIASLLKKESDICGIAIKIEHDSASYAIATREVVVASS